MGRGDDRRPEDAACEKCSYAGAELVHQWHRVLGAPVLEPVEEPAIGAVAA